MTPMLPVLARGGAAIASKVPDLYKAIKSEMPAAYSRLQSIVGLSNQTPERVAATAKKPGNEAMVQFALGNAIVAGVPPSYIRQAIPLLTDEDVKMLEASYMASARAVSVASDSVAGRPAPAIVQHLDVHKANRIRRCASALNLTLAELADVIETLNTTTRADIKEVESGLTVLGRGR